MSNYKAWHWIEKQLVVAWAVIKRIDANSDSNNITLCTEPICVPLLPATDLDYSGDVTYNLSLTEEVVQIFPARHGTMKVEIVRDSLVHPERHSVEGLRHWIGYEHPGTSIEYAKQWSEWLRDFKFFDEQEKEEGTCRICHPRPTGI